MNRQTSSVLAVLLISMALNAGADPEPSYDPAKAVLGNNLFLSHCASCHGLNAEGDGSLAEVLRTPPGNLTQLTVDNAGTFPEERTYKVIDGREEIRGHGSADMPAWGDAFAVVASSEEEVAEKIDRLVHFIKSVQK